MKRKYNSINFKLTLYFLALLWLSSCKTAYYPTTHNSPMLNNKGEFQISGILGTGNLELQTAYAITNNIGIMVNGSYFNEDREIKIDDEVTEITLTHNLIEAGVGYFTKLGGLGKFEVFAGGGVGSVPANFREITYVFDGTQTDKMTKFFVQPSVGIGSDFLDFSGGVRISGITMNKQLVVFAEPELSIKLGYKNVRFVASMGLSLPLNNTDNLTWNYNPLIIGLGIQINLGRKYE
ncbi:MAG: hypothetical protein PHD06_02445 [Bacteroidales bacterium]|nr:hypothetical protein [Bacteroidales bacterium]